LPKETCFFASLKEAIGTKRASIQRLDFDFPITIGELKQKLGEGNKRRMARALL